MITRTEVCNSQDFHAGSYIYEMEEAGWSVRSITSFSWGDVNDIQGLIQAIVVFEREDS